MNMRFNCPKSPVSIAWMFIIKQLITLTLFLKNFSKKIASFQKTFISFAAISESL